MDNLLKATDISSLKGARRCHDEELSRAARSVRPHARNDSGHRRKVIGLGPESVIGLTRNPHAPLTFNLSGEVPGSMYAVNAFSFSPLDDAQPFVSTHGPAFRAIYDLADLDRSLFIHSTGQSGNVLSSWYRNFEKGWRDGGYITIPIGRAEYESNAAGRLRLVPGRVHTWYRRRRSDGARGRCRDALEQPYPECGPRCRTDPGRANRGVRDCGVPGRSRACQGGA